TPPLPAAHSLLSLHDALPILLCDVGGAIKIIAEVKSDFAMKVGDLLSPLQNALYCINREKQCTVKVISASCYSVEEWARQCQSRSEEHTSELQSRFDLVCRLL